MKRANKVVRILAVIIVMCMMMATVASAAEAGKLWIRVTESENGKDTAALIVTDTTVTDGLVKVTYDPAKLTYKDLLVSSEYVAMHSVNAAEAGIILISWVAPEAYTADGTPITLIQINFEGSAEGTPLEATGVGHDAQGNEIQIGTVDTSALEEAIQAAEALKEDDYTEETWAALEEALENARDTLEDPTASQAEVDQAAKDLQDAIAALEDYVEPVDKTELEKAIDKAKAVDEDEYTADSYKAMEAALKIAESVYADEDATQEEVDAATKALNAAYKALVPTTGKNPGTGDQTPLVPVMAIAALAAVGIVALLVLKKNNKKGGAKK